MSSATENTEIRTRFNLLRDILIPVSWPNESFEVPNPPKTYVRFSIANGDSKLMDIGSEIKTYRNIGIIYLSLFCPPNTGNGQIMIQADNMANIFRSWNGQSVKCRTPSIKHIGTVSDGWYQVNVVIPFQRDELI